MASNSRKNKRLKLLIQVERRLIATHGMVGMASNSDTKRDLEKLMEMIEQLKELN